MRKLIAACLAGMLLASATLAIAQDKPKYTIKQVMKVAMKGGLLKKVAAGDASDEEKAKLVAMMEALSQNKPKKGSPESWKKLTSALVKAAKSGEGDALKAASNCAACHKQHKP